VSPADATVLPFEIAGDAGEAAGARALMVDVDGFEGPLDLLLNLARSQKVDITKISILALAEQYLAFIEEARKTRLELAADYLVMAAWLAYLKSRLLLPPEEDDSDEPTGEELAAHLAFRLQRLEAMRNAAARLMGRDRLGRDVFARGAPEAERLTKTTEYQDNLYDLLKAYAERRQRNSVTRIKIAPRPVWSIHDAREHLERLLGEMEDWGRIDQFLVQYMSQPDMRSSVVASSFSASLELARDGKVELRQDRAFEPIFMRRARRTDKPATRPQQ